MIAFLSDHGEHLGERDDWDHHPPSLKRAVHVPILLHHPDLPAGMRVPEPVQLIDVMPTVLEFAGVATDDLLLQGESLLGRLTGGAAEPPPGRNPLAVTEEVVSYDHDRPKRVRGSLFFRNWHWLRSRLDGEKGVYLFDVTEDPEEITPHTGVLRDPLIERTVIGWMRELKQANLALGAALAPERAEEVPLDPSEQEQLRALGYIE